MGKGSCLSCQSFVGTRAALDTAPRSSHDHCASEVPASCTMLQGPEDKYPMSVVPWAMWQVAMDRCSLPDEPQLVLIDCALGENTNPAQ